MLHAVSLLSKIFELWLTKRVHKYCFWLLKIAVLTTCIIIQMPLTPRMFSRPRVTGLLPSFSLQSWLLDDAFNIHLLSRSSISPPACKLGQWGEAGERESYTQLVHLNIVCPLELETKVHQKVPYARRRPLLGPSHGWIIIKGRAAIRHYANQ